MSSNLLINEPPMVYQPSLAAIIGLPQAVALQQIHYWIQRATKSYDDQMWVYKSAKELGTEIGLTRRQAERALKALKDANLLIAIRNPHVPLDRILWYRVNYEAMDALVRETPDPVSDAPDPVSDAPHSVTDAPISVHDAPEAAQLYQRLQPETKTEIETESMSSRYIQILNSATSGRKDVLLHTEKKSLDKTKTVEAAPVSELDRLKAQYEFEANGPGTIKEVMAVV